jgi:anti-sigma-K factor RskA
MEHEEYRELLALEALGALDAEQLRSLAAHVERCAECRRDGAQMRDAAASLAYTIAPVAPPASLRARVLESVKASKSVAETVVGVEEGKAKPTKPTKPAKPANDPRTPRAVVPRAAPPEYGTWQLLASRPPLMYGAMAAALLVAALAVASALLWNRTNEYRAELIRLSENANRSRAEASRQTEAAAERARVEADRAREVREMLAAPGARLIRLAGTESAPRARASVVYDSASGRALLLASELPPPPAGKAYQLWYIAGGPPQPGGTFTPDGQGGSVMRDQAPPEGRNASLFVVTLEPAGGVQAPTGDKYLLGSAS